jgi:exosome complex RNA-binding protein Rrp42 (RNase PH superfamily)
LESKQVKYPYTIFQILTFLEIETPGEDYVPIKVEIVSSLSKQLRPRARDAYLSKIEELEDRVQQIVDKYVPSKCLMLVEGKIAWKLMLDILIVGDLDYCELDLVSYAMRNSLSNCTLPEIKINFNSVTNDYNIEVMDESKKMFQAEELPHIFTVGKVGNNYFFDMEYKEFKALDTCFLGVTDNSGNILEFEKLGKKFSF